MIQNLESTLKLTKSLKNEIDQFDENLQSLLSKVEGIPPKISKRRVMR